MADAPNVSHPGTTRPRALSHKTRQKYYGTEEDGGGGGGGMTGVGGVKERTTLGGDVAQLVEHRTGTSLTQVRFPGAARDLSSRVNFQCRLSLTVSVHPRVQSHSFTYVRTLKIPYSMSAFGGLRKHSNTKHAP